MPRNLSTFIPTSKYDTDKAERLVAFGYPMIEPVLEEMFEWIQDENWPVARVFMPFLATIGAPLVPLVRHVLQSQDEQWKRAVLGNLVNGSKALAQALSVDLQRLINSPTTAETEEGLNAMADELFRKFCGSDIA